MFTSRLTWWRRAPKRPSTSHRPAEPLPELEEDQRPLGCGWFDSSHELQRGLIVIDPEWLVLSVPASAARTGDRCG